MRGKTLETMVATGLDTQGTGPVVLLGEAIVQRFITGLQPHLIPLRVLGRRHFQLGQGRHVVVGQFPSLIGIQVFLRSHEPVEHPVWTDGRVDQQSLEAMALGQVSRIVAAEGAADQQWPLQLDNSLLQLSDGLARVVMQGWHTQLIAQTQALHHLHQLRGLFRRRRAVETVYIKDRTGHLSSLCVG
ncbi:hypothetical protein J2X84_003555 [Pseudomonas corrugata]|nr:hypothetical protein [Pseudomonas corrugata]